MRGQRSSTRMSGQTPGKDCTGLCRAMKPLFRSPSISFLPVLILSFACLIAIRAQEPASPVRSSAQSDAPKYKDAALPIPDRVADLLSRMTLEEKVEQLKWDWQKAADVVDPTDNYTRQ